MKISIGCDHVGLLFKNLVIEHLVDRKIEVIDKGTYSDVRTDYPKYAELVSQSVLSGEANLGILICGTGVGISIAANKIFGIRAVVCSEPFSAKLSRQHNDTNILALGARVIGIELAKMIIDEWLDAKFEGGRHQKRVGQIGCIEQQNK